MVPDTRNITVKVLWERFPPFCSKLAFPSSFISLLIRVDLIGCMQIYSFLEEVQSVCHLPAHSTPFHRFSSSSQM